MFFSTFWVPIHAPDIVNIFMLLESWQKKKDITYPTKKLLGLPNITRKSVDFEKKIRLKNPKKKKKNPKKIFFFFVLKSFSNHFLTILTAKKKIRLVVHFLYDHTYSYVLGFLETQQKVGVDQF